jgi:hypothetical protein
LIFFTGNEEIMSDRAYRAILGTLLLVALSLEFNALMYALIVILFIEGLTNYRIPKVIGQFTGKSLNPTDFQEIPLEKRVYRFNFEAERAWRLLVGSMLLITYVFFYKQMWFFPWFMGFAIFGAGVSGVCPMKILVNKVGFK